MYNLMLWLIPLFPYCPVNSMQMLPWILLTWQHICTAVQYSLNNFILLHFLTPNFSFRNIPLILFIFGYIIISITYFYHVFLLLPRCTKLLRNIEHLINVLSWFLFFKYESPRDYFVDKINIILCFLFYDYICFKLNCFPQFVQLYWASHHP